MPASDVGRVARHLAEVGLPTTLSAIPGSRSTADQLMQLMSQDKKVKRGKLTLILARGIGAAFVAADVEAAEVRDFLAEQLSSRSIAP
jgi:3-dehydroquinate synthetase